MAPPDHRAARVRGLALLDISVAAVAVGMGLVVDQLALQLLDSVPELLVQAAGQLL